MYTYESEAPIALPIAASVIPENLIPAMLAICSSVNLFLGLYLSRPFVSMSFTLSDAVPAHKCSGLMQSGVSQEWQTYAPFGISPLKTMYEALCARYVLRLYSSCPYVPLFCPEKIQQPFSCFTCLCSSLAFNDSRSGGTLAFIDFAAQALPQNLCLAIFAGVDVISKSLAQCAHVSFAVGMTQYNTINGGTNGLGDRQALYAKAVSILGVTNDS